MTRIVSLVTATVLLFAFHPVHSEVVTVESQSAGNFPDSDRRQLVSMPEEARAIMRKDMLDHLSALNEILGYLAEHDLAAAANVAESRMGKSAMGRHRGTGMGPGRFMPFEMRNIGRGMHQSASEFSRVAGKGDLKSAYSALQKVTSACVACHYSYHTH